MIIHCAIMRVHSRAQSVLAPSEASAKNLSAFLRVCHFARTSEVCHVLQPVSHMQRANIDRSRFLDVMAALLSQLLES